MARTVNGIATAANGVVLNASVMQALWFGTDNNDTYNGAGDADTFYGIGGNDQISGGGGSDAVFAGEGSDTVNGEDGADYIYGDDGDDSLSGASGGDWLSGGSGADTLVGGIGDDVYTVDDLGDVIIEAGGEGMDLVYTEVNLSLTNIAVEEVMVTSDTGVTVVANALNNTLFSEGGSDSLSGQAGDDVIFGGDGNDSLAGGVGADSLWGGTGNDSYFVEVAGDEIWELVDEGLDTVVSSVSYVLSAFSVENLILTGSGHLNGTGDGLNNALTGNAGNNRLDGGGGVDTLAGGLGDDTYYVDNVSDRVVELSLEGTDTVVSSVSYGLNGRAVENLTLTGTGHLTATGNSLNNTLTGNGGNNLLDGGAGNDSLAGGLGNDTYVVDAAADVLSEGANAGVDVVQSSRTWTLGANFESLVLTGAGVANGTGNALDNLLTGNAAANILTGGLGNDTYVLQNTSDQAVELVGEGTDTIETNLTRTLSANIENLILTGTSAINGTGNVLGNRLTGNSTTNVLTGGAGNDTYVVQNTSDSVVELAGEGTDFVVASVSWTLSANVENITLTGAANLSATGNDLNNVLTGNAGNNILTGGLGDDIYYIQNAGDSVVEQHLQGTDTIVSGFSYSLFGRAVEILQLTGTDNINATGNSLNNSLLGNSGNNILDGGTGNDNLRGNGGADTFVFLTGSGKDTVRDFTAAQNDMIDIHAYTAGVANAGLVTQSGVHVLINLGGGNVVTVENAVRADVLAHLVW